MTSILEGPLREISPAISEISDISVLAELGTAERNGERRVGVLNAIQARIGAVMIAQGPASPTGEVEDLLAIPANAEMQRSGERSAIESGTVTSNRPKKAVLYFRGPHAYMPRLVTSGGLRGAIASGALQQCPDCLSPVCGLLPDGRLSGDVNACPERQPVPFSRCPVCRKREFDPGTVGSTRADREEGEIVISAYGDLTPDARIKARMETHMTAYHPEEAAALGLRPQTARDPVAGARAGAA